MLQPEDVTSPGTKKKSIAPKINVSPDKAKAKKGIKDEKHDEKKESLLGSTTKLDDIQKLLNSQIKELNALASRSKTENQLRAEFDEIKKEMYQMVTDVQQKLKIDELENSNNDKL